MQLRKHATKFVAIAICALVVTFSAYGSETLFFQDMDSNRFVRDFFIVLFWASPVIFLTQVGALVLLLWHAKYRGCADAPPVRPVSRLLLLLGVAVAPNVMLTVSVIFVGAYQEQYGHWFFHIHDGLAGLVLLPFYLTGSIIIGRGLYKPEFRLRSGLHFVVLLTLMGVCAWYAFATAILDMVTDPMTDLRFTAIVPAVAAGNYALLAIEIKRCGQTQPARRLDVIGWFSMLAVTIAVKIPLAMRAFEALPVERPSGYGDCFVVSAAARGHPRFVGSYYDRAVGRSVNSQLHTLRAFEHRLAQRHPALHHRLRRLYNRIGPPIAAYIRSPLSADVMYLLLKPAEWLARLYLAKQS